MSPQSGYPPTWPTWAELCGRPCRQPDWSWLLERLASPFEQVESQHAKTQQGTGLGLALSKALIGMHGGALDIQSEPGKGTTVTFNLALRQEGAASGESVFAAE